MSKEKRKIIQSVALDALREHAGRWKPAAEQLVRTLRGRRDSTFAELAHIGAYYLVRRIAENDRRYIKAGNDSQIYSEHGGTGNPADGFERAADALRYRGLWGYSLMGGLALGDAKGSELDAEIVLRWKLSASNASEARMLERVRAQVSDDQRVRDVLSPEQLDELQDKEEKAA